MKEPKKLYKKIFDTTGKEISVLNKKNKKMTLVRGFSFLLSILPLFVFLPQKPVIAISAFSFFLFLFFYSIVKQTRYKTKIQFLSVKHTIVEKEIEALDGDISSFDTGKEFDDTNHDYSNDLDLFGKKSLFQFINRARTTNGQKIFSNWLKNPSINKNDIIEKQKAVSELSNNTPWIINYYATEDTSTDIDKTNQIISWLSEPTDFLKKQLIYVINIITIITLLLFIITIYGHFSTMGFILYLFAIPLGYTSLKIKKINHLHQQVSKTEKNLKLYSRLINLVEEEKFESQILFSLKNNLSSDNIPASKKIKELAKLSAALDNRLNIFVGIILNSFLLWDLRLARKLEQWKKENNKVFNNWIDTLNKFDAYNSMGLFAFNNPNFIYPKINKNVIIDAEEAGHIFIPEKKRVGNVINIKNHKQFHIITGANMAGKSTYLRTIGINLILATAGMPVCAKKFDFSPIRLFTSMRTDDSLQSDESYFFAELKRLKQLIDILASGEKRFIILDEILKGTNSIDKQKGSFALLKQLIAMNAVGIIATHDLALAELKDEFPENIKNRCFEVDTIDDKLKFTYLVSDGVAHNMNATLLMRKMGITI